MDRIPKKLTPAERLAHRFGGYMRRIAGRAFDHKTPRHKHRRILRVWCSDRLPLARFLFVGPKWRRHFGVERQELLGAKILVVSLEDDVRELIINAAIEMRPGVVPEWIDELIIGRPIEDSRSSTESVRH